MPTRGRTTNWRCPMRPLVKAGRTLYCILPRGQIPGEFMKGGVEALKASVAPGPSCLVRYGGGAHIYRASGMRSC